MAILRLFLLLILVLSGLYLAHSITRRIRRRTLRAWDGEGANRDLPPEAAALVMGAHPLEVLYHLTASLRDRGLVELVSIRPLRLRPTGRPPSGPVEARFLAMIRADGAVDPERALDALETLYVEVDGRMVPWSGNDTSFYYAELADGFWSAAAEGREPPPEAIPWLLLGDAGPWWEAVPRRPAFEPLRAAVREKNLFRDGVMPLTVLERRIARAREGYFAYRRDLVEASTARAKRSWGW